MIDELILCLPDLYKIGSPITTSPGNLYPGCLPKYRGK